MGNKLLLSENRPITIQGLRSVIGVVKNVFLGWGRKHYLQHFLWLKRNERVISITRGWSGSQA